MVAVPPVDAEASLPAQGDTPDSPKLVPSTSRRSGSTATPAAHQTPDELASADCAALLQVMRPLVELHSGLPSRSASIGGIDAMKIFAGVFY